MVYYWNFVRHQLPNIQIRLQRLDNFRPTPQVGLGQAIWLSCSLEDKSRENRLYAGGASGCLATDSFFY